MHETLVLIEKHLHTKVLKLPTNNNQYFCVPQGSTDYIEKVRCMCSTSSRHGHFGQSGTVVEVETTEPAVGIQNESAGNESVLK